MRKLLPFVLSALAVMAISSVSLCADDVSKYLRAYPDPIPTDASFETVVSSQPFPAMTYPVPIIGWKHHPEEVHVTTTGALVFPRYDKTGGIYLAPLIGSSGQSDAPAILDPIKVTQKLVDGYMPGVESAWTRDGLQIRELAFCTLLDGTEVKTGKEPLVAFSRYTVTNKSKAAKQTTLWLNFGAAIGGRSMSLPPLAYCSKLSLDQSLVVEPTGDIAAALLTKGLNATFHQLPLPPVADRADYAVVNESEAGVPGTYDVEISRDGDIVTVGNWKSSGVDLHLEASLAHSLPITADISFLTPDGKSVDVGKLFRTGLFQEFKPVSDYILRGQHSTPVMWSTLSKLIPQGKSRMVFKSYFSTGGDPQLVGTWEPIIYFSKPGVVPNFKRPLEGSPKENSLEIELTLRPGESKSVDIALPYFALPRGKSAEFAKLGFDDRLKKFRGFWKNELNCNAQFVVPEARIQNLYRAAVANNLMLVDKEPGNDLLLIHPDPTAYEAVWAGDSGVIIQAMDRFGYHKEAEEYLNYFLAKQGTRMPDAEVDSCDGFFTGDAIRWLSENGFILWAMAEHYNLTGDKVWLKRVSSNLIKSADWIINQRAKTKVLISGEKPRHFGLLPKGAPSDIGRWDNWYWTDTYSYMGLRNVADVLADIGMKDEAARFSLEADDYKACILDSVKRSLNRDVTPPYVPASPYTNGNPSPEYLNECWYSICGPVYMVEAGIVEPNDPLTTSMLYWLEKYALYTGLPAFGSGSIDPHYVYNQSLAHLLRGETDKFVWTFYSLFAYGQSRDTYATIEGQNLVAGNIGDTWNVYRQPHMQSNGRVLSMVRTSLVIEYGDKLHLLAGTPRSWLDNGKKIEIKRAPTSFGDLSLKAVSSRGTVTIAIDPPTRKAADVVLHVRPPSKYGKLKSVTVNGEPWTGFKGEEVDLGKLTKKTEVTCNF